MSALDKLQNHPGKSALATVYLGFVLYGGIRGVVSGWKKYNKWRETRKEIDVKSDLYNPIVNTVVDVGTWTNHVVLGGVGSAVIAGTAPISVPLIRSLREIKDVEATSGRDNAIKNEKKDS